MLKNHFLFKNHSVNRNFAINDAYKSLYYAPFYTKAESMPLSNAQTRHLRSLAHHLKPVVWVGQHGLRDSVMDEITLALDTHELIKVKIAAEKEERLDTIVKITKSTGAELIQHIGQIAILFRRNTKKPKVALPSA
jgi:RNA-binding protein